MGRIKRKNTIPLSLFYLQYFAYIFIGMFFLVIGIFGLFNFCMNLNVVYPANYAEEQAKAAYYDILKAESITEEMIPEFCDYAVFDADGNYRNGNLTEKDAANVWEAISKGITRNRKYSYLLIPRYQEYCVLRYRIIPQYKSPFLQQTLAHPQNLIFITAILGMFLLIVVVAIRFGKGLDKRLGVLVLAANKIEHRNLDFEIQDSGIKEVDDVLHSMDKMRAALKDSLEQQWKMEQEKNRQMSALAHDLKTPLTLVRGNAELLLEAELPEFEKNCTEYIASSALQMQNYVQTLIEVTKSGMGYQFRPQQVSCDMLFGEIRKQLEGLCTVHNLIPVWDCTYSTRQVNVDHDMFMRAIVNVISNATDRTPAGGTVTCLVKEAEGKLIFIIKDTGSGFSKEALKHGTEQFYMDDSSRNSKTHFGIGLYSANSIIQNHGGELSLSNAAKKGGAVVTITIPIN